MIIRIVTSLLLLSCCLPSVASSLYQLKKPRASLQQIAKPSTWRQGQSRGQGGRLTRPVVTNPLELQTYRLPFATFFKNYDTSFSNKPRFHTLRTNGWKSLSVLTGLPSLTFAALLLTCKLMEIKRHSDGSYLVEVAVPEWESFFHQYGLKAIGSGKREGITSQLQFGGVYKDALTSDQPVLSGGGMPEGHGPGREGLGGL